MQAISLKVTRPAAASAVEHPSSNVNPLFRGTGDTNYLCGDCGAVIAANMGPRQRVMVDTAVCSACGAENEFPPNLRA